MLEILIGIFLIPTLLRAYSFGVFSPYFLALFHFYLGIIVRYVFLNSGGGEEYIMRSSDNSIELSVFAELVSYYLLFVLFFELFYIKTKAANSLSLYRLPVLSSKAENTFLSLALMVFSLYVITLLIYLGGFSAVLYAFSVRVSGAVNIPVYLTLLPDLYVIISFFLFYNFVCGAGSKGKALFVVIVGLLMLIVSGARGNLIQYVITLMMIWYIPKSGRVYFNFKIFIFIVFVLIVLFVGLANRLAVQNNLDFRDVISEVSDRSADTLTGPFAIYDHYGLSRVYADELGYDYGAAYLSNITRPIPRSLWPDKPQALGKLVRNHFWGDTMGGVPPGLIGEFYISGGILAAILLMPLFSYLVCKINHLYEISLSEHELVLFVAVFTPYVFFSLIRLGVDVAFTRILIYVFFFFILKKISLLNITLKGIRY